MQFLTLSLFSMSAMAAEGDVKQTVTTKTFDNTPTCTEEKDFVDCASDKVVDENNKELILGEAGFLEFCWTKKTADAKTAKNEKCPILVATTTGAKQDAAELKTAKDACLSCKKSAAAYTGAFIGLLALLI